jgi:hypothetical protein
MEVLCHSYFELLLVFHLYFLIGVMETRTYSFGLNFKAQVFSEFSIAHFSTVVRSVLTL